MTALALRLRKSGHLPVLSAVSLGALQLLKVSDRLELFR